jgi:hypothetical protein
MSQNHTPQPGRKAAVPLPWAEPGIAPSPFFTIPTPNSGDIAPPYPQMPETTPQQPWPGSPQLEPTDQRIEQEPDHRIGQGSDQELQAPQRGQQRRRLATPARLQRLCHHLRATNRCPGECVLSRARHEPLG